MKIYVASSWRNDHQPGVVAALRAAGHEVYDFRNPDGEHGYSWSQIDPDWQDWTPAQFVEALNNPIAQKGYKTDHDAMDWADICVQVQPCGVSAAIELGEFIGSGRNTIVYMAGIREPDLMLAGATRLCLTLDEVLSTVDEFAIDQRLPLESDDKKSSSIGEGSK